MKFTIICLFFAAMCFSSAMGQIEYEGIKLLREDQKHCAQQSGLSLEQVETVRRNKKINGDESQEKFAVCMLKKLHIMNMDESINENRFAYNLLTDNPMSMGTAYACVGRAGANARETAQKIMTCLLQTDDLDVLVSPTPRPLHL